MDINLTNKTRLCVFSRETCLSFQNTVQLGLLTTRLTVTGRWRETLVWEECNTKPHSSLALTFQLHPQFTRAK